MANKTSTPRVVTHKHLARQEKEHRQIKTALILTAVILTVVAVMVGYALVDTLIVKPNQVVASVGDTKIRVSDFQTDVKYTRLNMINRANQYYQYAQMFGSYGTQFLTTAQTMLTQLADPLQIGESVLNSMVDDAIIEQEAAKRGITVSQAEIDEAMRDAFGFFPNGTKTPTITPTTVNTPTLSGAQIELIKPTDTATPAPTATQTPEGFVPTATQTSTPLPTEVGATATLVPTETQIPTETPIPSVTPTPTLYTTQLFAKEVKTYVNSVKAYGITDAQLEKVFRASLLREKLMADVTKDIAPEQEQVWARHILVSTEEEANTVLEKLNAGEDWATLAATYSIDTSNKDNGGDLGWFGRGVMIQEFEDAAFALTDIGQVSNPVQTSEGWHIIQLVGKSTNPLTADAFSQLKETTFTNWLKDLRDSRTDVNIDPIWSEYTPSIPAVPSDLQSAIFSS